MDVDIIEPLDDRRVIVGRLDLSERGIALLEHLEGSFSPCGYLSQRYPGKLRLVARFDKPPKPRDLRRACGTRVFAFAKVGRRFLTEARRLRLDSPAKPVAAGPTTKGGA